MEIFRTLRVGLGVNSTLAPLTVSQKASLGLGYIADPPANEQINHIV